MSEINPTDHKSITARHIPRNNTRVEADFSIWRDYGPSKRHYRVHHVWCLDPENTKDFFEKVWDYQVKNTTLRFFSLHRFMFHNENLAGKRRSSPSSCCLQGIRFPCAESLPRLVQPPLTPLPGRAEPFHAVQAPLRRRSIDSSTSDFASLSPELEDMEVEFPASPPWDPKTRPFGKRSRESSSIGL